ncbi:hypothetical protein ACOMHN_004315 [Nucella lapillus]
MTWESVPLQAIPPLNWGKCPSAGDNTPDLGKCPSAGDITPHLGKCPSAGDITPDLGKCPSAGDTTHDLGKCSSMLNVCWWYYISKYIEVLDTVFFVVRKKNSQITFLHVYHHATMIPFWWLAASFVPGGRTFFHPLLNTGIHVLMYTYYGLAALGPKLQPFLWWKKYLTTLQLIQFVLIGLHVSYSLFFQPDCPYSKPLELLALAYAIILIILFANFYRQAYVRKQQHKLADHETNGDAGGAVSFPCMLNDSEYTRGKGD